MAEQQDSTDRTEEPSQRRLDEAWERGQLPVARDVHHAAFLLAATAMVLTASTWAGHSLLPVLRGLLAQAGSGFSTLDGMRAVATGAAGSVVLALALPAVILLVATLVAAIGQGGIAWSTQALAPKLERLSPAQGLTRLFGGAALVEFVKNIAKVVIVFAGAWFALRAAIPHIVEASALPLPAVLISLGKLMAKLLGTIAGILTLLAVIDLVWRRIEHHRRLRMTRQELKDEMRQSEGDPIIKQRLRSLRMQRARRRMMSQVPSATVVITNPTHFAVALKYEPSMPAPVVVAKGVDRVALRIREVAKEHGVPIMENPPLARSLHASVELEAPIPPEHYRAVAELIAIVLRLKRNGKS